MPNEEKRNETRGFPSVVFDEFPEATYEGWKVEVEKLLKGAPFEKRMYTKTYEGITLDGMYWREALDDLPNLDATPGETPYLRGGRAGGYAVAPWGIAQETSAADPVEANLQLRDDLAKGATVVNLPFDEATRRCADEPLHLDGRRVSVTTVADMTRLLEGVDLTVTPLYLYVGAEGLPLAGLLAAHCKTRGVGFEKLSGCLGVDPMGELARWGTLDDSMENLLNHLAILTRDLEDRSSELRCVVADGAPYADGGASSVQELAAVVATAIEYVRGLTARGLSVAQVGRRLRFSLTLGANFFMEIAKLRALRVLWATVAEAFGGDAEAQKSNVFASTSRFTATAVDPYVNILRSTTQTFSGVVGGADVMQVGPFDRTVRPSTEQARRIARNQQIMFQTEFNMITPVDPAGGSWYVEKLTAQLAESAWELVQAIEAQGGMLEALKKGFIQSKVATTLTARFKALASRKDRIVGVNMYANMAETPLDPSTFDEAAFRADRAAALVSTKAARDRASVMSTLAALKAGPCVSAAAAAAEAGATLAELAGALRSGADSLTVEAIEPHGWAEQFETLRRCTEDWVAAGRENVKIFLCNMGPIPQHKPRADFSRGFMEVAHFDVIGNDGFATPEEAAAAAVASGAAVAVICSTDATYLELVPPVARAIKAEAPQMKVFLAGAPAPEMKDAYVEAGVDDFIHVKADCLEILSRIQREGGMC